MSNILVLGAGAWGTAVANLIAKNTNRNVYLWSNEKKVADEINSLSINKKYLPKKKISHNIIASNHLPDTFLRNHFHCNSISIYLRFFKKFKSIFYNYKELKFVICSKGIDLKEKELLSNILKSFFQIKDSYLKWTIFAAEVLNNKPTAITLATKNTKLANITLKLLSNNHFRVYHSKDIIGVQINGTMKNVLAIAAGLTEGLKLGENARAALIARDIKEIIRLVDAFGGKKETVIGLSGMEIFC